MERTPLKPLFEGQSEVKETAIEELTNYITINCRLKPLLQHEVRSKIDVDFARNQITMSDPAKSINKIYKFDKVYDEAISQDKFAASICLPLIASIKNGTEAALIFSYGITNSGKTYTILGTPDQPGILLTLISKLGQEFPEETLRIVAIELYKDEFMSLKNKGQKLQPKEVKGTLSFEDCDSDEINESNMNELFEKYLQNRSCSSNSLNNFSSRSHAIFKITSKNFKIGVVDLAGSQRMSKHTATTKPINKNIKDEGVDPKETIFINRSLMTLRKCIKVLEQRSTATQKLVVPYRESKLTQALMEYFIFNSKIGIIVNLNQAQNYLQQNLIAMDYTSKAKNITANATSAFSKMFKSTAKKQVGLISSFKPKIQEQPQSHSAWRREQEKRLSANLIGTGERFIIKENPVDEEDPERILQQEIEEQEHHQQMMNEQDEQMFNQLVHPVSIEDFIEKQRLFREVYLQHDMAIQKESDERQLSALKKVNLWETTGKKPESPRNLVNPIETAEVGTEIMGGDLWGESDELEEKLINMEFEKIRTEVKNRLMKVLDEEKRKQLVDAETMWSERKCVRKSQSLQKVEMNRIQEVFDDDQSNFTTPGKKPFTSSKSLQKSINVVQGSVEAFSKKPNIFSVVASGAKSAVNGIASCVKSGASYLGLGNSILKSNNKGKVLKPNPPKFNLKMMREVEILIKPSNKIVYEIATETEVEIVASNKKINVLERQPVMNEDGEIQIDAEPILVEKEIIVETCEVGIQTDKIQPKYFLQDVLDKNIEEVKQKNKNANKGRKKKNPYSIFSEDSTVHGDEEQDTVESPGEKPKHIEKPKHEEKQHKKPVKNFSINKRNVEMSLSKHKAMMSAARTAIAKHTRAAQKKKENQC